MAKKVKSFRLDVDLIDWVDGYATERKSTQAAVVEEALRSFKADSEGGVPDLPAEVSAPETVAVRSTPSVFADAKGSRQQRLNAAMLRSRSRS